MALAREPWILAALGVAVVVLLVGAYRVNRQAHAVHGAEMGLMDHLRELRYRVLSIVGIGGGAALLAFAVDVRRLTWFGLSFWGPAISVTDSVASRALRWLLVWLTPDGVALVVMTPFEAVGASITAAILVGLVLSSPLIAYHVAAFVAPALHDNERKVVMTIAPASLVLFLAGAAFAVLLLVPTALRFLYLYAGALGADALARPGDLLAFAGLTSLVMGIAFQLPLVMVALSRVGVVHPKTYAQHWRGVIVVTLIVAAVVTPDPTVTSQMFVAVPTLGLYFLGIGLSYLVYRRR